MELSKKNREEIEEQTNKISQVIGRMYELQLKAKGRDKETIYSFREELAKIRDSIRLVLPIEG